MNKQEENTVFNITDRQLIEDIRWVMLILPKQEHRPWLKFLHVENDTLFASDGHRIHAVSTIAIPRGTYEIIKNTFSIMILKPCSREDVFSDQPSGQSLFFNTVSSYLQDTSGDQVQIDDWLNNDSIINDAPLMFCRLYRRVSNWYNYQYFADALGAITSPATDIYEKVDAGFQQLFFKGERRQAVLMAIRKPNK